MSAQPSEEIGPEGRWFGDDYGENGLSGNAPGRFDGLHDEFKPKGNEKTGDLDQQFRSSQDEGKRPAVAMETASTDALMSGLFKKGLTDDDDGDVYTSLMSNQSYTTSYDSPYVTETSKASSTDYSFSTKKDLLDDMSKSYNYMDISHGEEHSVKHGLLDSPGCDALGGYMDKSPGRGEEEEEEEEDEEENLGPALGSHSFPYVEEPSDEEMSDYRSYRNLGGTPQASPVKITLTESKPTQGKMESQQRPVPASASDTENILSVGVKGVPTVTLSEPEDESPASTPNASPTHKEFPAKPAVVTHDGSSAESGDSEIELVSEETNKKSTNPFSQAPRSSPSNPSDHVPLHPKGALGLAGTHAAPPTYSILREEREAELDSDLFIESASEESPKREQGFGGPKHIPPSPLVPTTTTPPCAVAEPVQSMSAEKAKVQVKTEEERPKAKPPTAAVTPEVRAANKAPAADMEKGEVKKTNIAVFFQGFNKEKAMDLLYWRNVKQSGAVFSSVLLLLFSLTQFSVVSVAAYLALAALSATISFRIYKSVLQAVQKTDEGHPFKAYLEIEMTLSQDQISKYADKILLYTNTCMKELRRLFLVQDLVDSLKFAVLMWLLTYVGALFNGLTLLILGVVSMFTMPVVYEKHQAQIDQYVGLIRTQVNGVVGKIQAKIPGAKRKEE
ncbi:reticulon-1a isoform X1 [Periophthalmus magnuspinnatus]|uniref:Reticulon n=2 Tax=Oxudercinae TaxID=497678 RepID=A0A3B4A5E4_9GOBI|nr:reticulon-1a isoform X1 [Periophthalmus magnuspinnatus]